jgi:hypothetical protein
MYAWEQAGGWGGERNRAGRQGLLIHHCGGHASHARACVLSCARRLTLSNGILIAYMVSAFSPSMDVVSTHAAMSQCRPAPLAAAPVPRHDAVPTPQDLTGCPAPHPKPPNRPTLLFPHCWRSCSSFAASSSASSPSLCTGAGEGRGLATSPRLRGRPALTPTPCGAALAAATSR